MEDRVNDLLIQAVKDYKFLRMVGLIFPEANEVAKRTLRIASLKAELIMDYEKQNVETKYIHGEPN